MAHGGNQPRTCRRNLLALGADSETIHMATRSRKGDWWMSQNEYRGAGWTGAKRRAPKGCEPLGGEHQIVRCALNNRWLEEQGVPDMKAIWIVVALATLAPSGSPFGLAVSLTLGSLRAESPCLIGTALYNAPAAVAASKSAKPDRMDEAQRSQSRTQGGVGPGS